MSAGSSLTGALHHDHPITIISTLLTPSLSPLSMNAHALASPSPPPSSPHHYHHHPLHPITLPLDECRQQNSHALASPSSSPQSHSLLSMNAHALASPSSSPSPPSPSLSPLSMSAGSSLMCSSIVGLSGSISVIYGGEGWDACYAG